MSFSAFGKAVSSDNKSCQKKWNNLSQKYKVCWYVYRFLHKSFSYYFITIYLIKKSL